MANPDGSMDGWAALQHQGPEEGFTPEEPLSSGLSPAAAADVMRNVAAIRLGRASSFDVRR